MKKLATALRINSIGGLQTTAKDRDYGFVFSKDIDRWIYSRKLRATRRHEAGKKMATNEFREHENNVLAFKRKAG